MGSFVTNGEHDQMMRDQQRDLNRIATALEMSNQLKVLELYIYKEDACLKDRITRENINHLWDKLAKRNGYAEKVVK